MRQDRNLEPRSDSIGTEKALDEHIESELGLRAAGPQPSAAPVRLAFSREGPPWRIGSAVYSDGPSRRRRSGRLARGRGRDGREFLGKGPIRGRPRPMNSSARPPGRCDGRIRDGGGKLLAAGRRQQLASRGRAGAGRGAPHRAPFAEILQRPHRRRGCQSRRACGEVVGLLGPNGAGKTTTFYMIVGLVPADAGRSCSTIRTSPTRPSTGARGSASAICRRRRRSSAG